MDRLLKRCHIRNQLLMECVAECLGIYIVIIFGCGSVAQVTTSVGIKGHYLSSNLAFALGIAFGGIVSRGVSGGHLNPAMTLSLCVLGRHPWMKLPFYTLSHLLGAFLGAATVYLQYYDAIQTYSGGKLTVTGPNATAGIFATYPADYLSAWGGFVDQVIGSAVLLLCGLAIRDQRHVVLPDRLQPVMMGAVILMTGVSMGSNCGYPLNPARDLGPRLFTSISGWGVEVFKAGGGWWWVPIVAPCVGALLGTLTFELVIEAHHPNTLNMEPSPAQELEDVELEEVVVDYGNCTGGEPSPCGPSHTPSHQSLSSSG